jgi:hypothetical protein
MALSSFFMADGTKIGGVLRDSRCGVESTLLDEAFSNRASQP